MRASLGYAALSVGGASCLLGIVTLVAGIRAESARLIAVGRRYVFGIAGGSVVACAVMEWALNTHDYTLKYVADNVANATPRLFTITALWGALEGSILLWSLILSTYLVVVTILFRKRGTDPLVAWATITGYCVALFFFGLMLGPANPFRVMSGLVPANGAGPNPLLQNNVIMAFHPPILYAGYVGMTVPFMFAVGALVTGRFGEGWLADVRRSTLIAWGCLTIGIVLGAWWSYEVLGWGGYWSWDPVENASFMPWLTATAFIHSLMVQERRGMLRVWNLSLVIATFSLTILGTFLTRSGVINSVHAFSQSNIGPSLLGFLGVVVAVGLGLIAWRADKLHAPGRIDSPVSREAAFLANNLLFTGFAFVVLMGTVFPLLAEAIADRQLSVGQPYFDRLVVPIGIALLFLMAVAPALPWRATSGEVLRRRLLVPAYIGVATMIVTLLFGAHGVAQIVSFGLGAFALAGIGRNLLLSVRTRRKAFAEAPPRALVNTVRSNPRLYGGLIVHAGVVIIAIALGVSSGYATRREVSLQRGETATVAGYRVKYLGSSTSATGQKTTVAARVQVFDGGHSLGVYEPAISSYPNVDGGIGTPSVHTGILRDLYLTLVSNPSEGRVTIGVAVNPLVIWLWIGGLVMGLGTAIALVPMKKRTIRRPTRREPEAVAAPPEAPENTGDLAGVTS
ncbi:MAG TPA: heme lyase CcmF/NrfE family subunit [Acidimicrobiia bacterium]|nr:heme lyase CcmF/NrfE family subunit [Acidimicrobiia bacterium]